VCSPRRHPNVVNIDEIEPRNTVHGQKFASSRKLLGSTTGARGLGCSWFEVPPGRTAFPRHFHCANEEALFILDGEGTLHLGDATVELRPGDYATFPVGPVHAHVLVNRGPSPLRYLCFSTMLPTDLVCYPDSRKVLAIATPSPAGHERNGGPWIRLIVPDASSIDFYDGEEANLEDWDGHGRQP
jgi:uncharacterized cupin superfamily protein